MVNEKICSELIKKNKWHPNLCIWCLKNKRGGCKNLKMKAR
jgi:hypothetical protein